MITLWAAVPYLRDISRGTTRPRLASWVIWASAMGIGAASAFRAGQVLPGVFIAACAGEAAAVAVLGAARGDRDVTRLDAACSVLALAALVLLVAVRVPAAAAALSVTVDLLAYAPTIRHAWEKPGEETWQTFALYGMAAALALAVTDWRSPAGLAYPLYLAVFDTSAGALILARRHVRRRDRAAGIARGARPSVCVVVAVPETHPDRRESGGNQSGSRTPGSQDISTP